MHHDVNPQTTFPAIVSFDGKKYQVDFIDLKECSTVGNSIQEACSIAQRKMVSFLQAHSDIAKPNLDFSNISLSNNQLIVLITADMNIFRDTRAVKKTLTIPSWLNDMALEKGINFSQLLQKALKEELGITD